MKKCCLNCVFCARYINNLTNTLTDEERKQAFLGNFDFVGKEQRAQKTWQLQYKKIYEDLSRGVYHDKLGGPRVLEILTSANNPNDFRIMSFPNPIIEMFNLPPYPDAPYQDFLVCWHNLWNFQGKEQEFSSLNQKNKCLFFYPYNQKGHKSFEGCEKEREALLAKSRFTIANWLVIWGIFVTILIFAVQKFSTDKTISSQQYEQRQATEGTK